MKKFHRLLLVFVAVIGIGCAAMPIERLTRGEPDARSKPVAIRGCEICTVDAAGVFAKETVLQGKCFDIDAGMIGNDHSWWRLNKFIADWQKQGESPLMEYPALDADCQPVEISQADVTPEEALSVLEQHGLDTTAAAQNSTSRAAGGPLWSIFIQFANRCLSGCLDRVANQRTNRGLIASTGAECSPASAMASVMTLEAAVLIHEETANKSDHDRLASLAGEAVEEVEACMENR